MKSWFDKLRISTAIDSGKSLPPSLQKQIAASEELQRFSEDVEHLEQAFKKTGPMMVESPANLHPAIMAAVRNQSARSPRPTSASLLRWVPVPALASLLIWAMVYFSPTASDNPAEAFASTISSLNHEMELAQSTSQGVIAPLSEEWNHLHRDVEQAKFFLMASLP